MQVHILGPLEVISRGNSLHLGGPKQRTILALLALRCGQVVSIDELIDAGWGDDMPANPANTLQYQVAQLRKLIEDDPAQPKHLLTMSPGYCLSADYVTTDVELFATGVTKAREALAGGEQTKASELLDAALALWRGPALVQFHYEDFALADTERLEAERVTAIELQIDIAMAAGQHDQVTAQLAQLTQEHPFREGLWARYVLALYRSARQSEALRALQNARDTLGKIGLDPGSELRDLERQILDQDTSLEPLKASPQLPPNNLPIPPNRLIGRDTDIDTVCDLLANSRLVTLLGPGGAGKTRVAVAVGERLTSRYPGGVWFVPLDNLDDPALVSAELGRRTVMRENPDQPVLETLAEHLNAKPTLLIIDNCEHLIDEVASIAHELLSNTRHLNVLATSQAILDTTGEVVFTVSPLAVPGQTASIYDPLLEVHSVALFIERAREVGATVDTWDDTALAAVANIVSALDGIPLALELAAARTRSMSLEEIATGLIDRFKVLSRGHRTAPDRQRSLLGAVQWSLNLLEAEQRDFLAKLSVFSGGFNSEDAAAVTNTSISTTRDELSHLVDRSLLCRWDDVAGAATFTLLESLRQHGLGALESSIVEETRDRHLAHFAAYVIDADIGIRGPDQVACLHRIDAAYDNIRSALAWSLDGGSLEAGLSLATNTGRYWDWRGLLVEASAWTTRLCERAVEPLPGLGSVRAWSSFVAWEFGYIEQAKVLADQALADAEAVGDPDEIALALTAQVLTGRSDIDSESSRSASQRIITVAGDANNPWLVAWAYSSLATLELEAKDLEASEQNAQESIALFVELGDHRGEGWGLISLAQLYLAMDDLDKAGSYGRAGLKAASSVEDGRSVLWVLEVLAATAHQQGDFERSARLWGAAHPLRESRGIESSVSKLDEPGDLKSLLSDELGDSFGSLLEQGRRDPDAVITSEVG